MEVNDFWIKKKNKFKKILKKLSSKNNFPQSPESIKKYSSEYNGSRSAIKYI